MNNKTLAFLIGTLIIILIVGFPYIISQLVPTVTVTSTTTVTKTVTIVMNYTSTVTKTVVIVDWYNYLSGVIVIIMPLLVIIAFLLKRK